MHLTRIPPRELLAQACSALAANRLRSLLSMLGVTCGIATIITALAIGAGARRAALDEISSLGIDNVLVRRSAAHADRERPASLSLTDAAAIDAALQDARAVAGARIAEADIDVDGRHATAPLLGVTTTWRDTAAVSVSVGRWIAPADSRRRHRVAVIGAALARELFANSNPLGVLVRINGSWFTVIGVLAEPSAATRRAAEQRIDLDRAVVVPLAGIAPSGEAIARPPDAIDEVAIRTAGPDAVEASAHVARAVMQRRHPDGNGYEVVVPRELLAARLRAQRGFDAMLIGVGLMALIISGVGIMNIMLTSVAERVGEIGVRRAFGARRAEIVVQFAFEAAVLSAAGGLVGVPLGVAAAVVVSFLAGWPVTVTVSAVALAIVMATTTGLVFGTYPARTAARIEPAAALRAH